MISGRLRRVVLQARERHSNRHSSAKKSGAQVHGWGLESMSALVYGILTPDISSVRGACVGLVIHTPKFFPIPVPMWVFVGSEGR